MGLDVFAFDSTAEIFSRPANISLCKNSESDVKSPTDIEIESILTDRMFQTDVILAGNSGTVETVQAVTALNDNDEVVIVDDSRVFRYNYLDSYVAPVTSRNFSVIQRTPIAIDSMMPQTSAYPFSQFDLLLCEKDSDTSGCDAAHDLESDDWQFITGCDVDGCRLSIDTSDYCATAQELVANPNAGDLCTVSDYRHLGELNTASNDAEFRGFMQYDQDFIKSLNYILHEDSLFITARMNEKEILLRYFYNIDISGAKSDREAVLFGARKNHYGLDVYINESNLFATVLWEMQKRENECYKNYQRVECDLGNTESGGPEICTANDLTQGACVNGFQEYESTALFCSAAELTSGTCNDNEILYTENLVVHSADESAKWMKVYDLASNSNITEKMYLLTDDKDSLLDEGVLTSPLLREVDNVTGEPSADNVLGQLTSHVEAVRSGWVANENFALFDVVTEEVESIDEIVEDVNSVSNIYMVIDPSSDGSNKQIINVGEVKYSRPITKLDSSEE